MADTRIAPAGPSYRDEEAAELAKWMPGSEREPLALFRTLVRDPALAAAMRGMGGHMLRTGSIDARTRELVILRVCARLACEYEWGVHVAQFSHSAGLTADEVAATAADAVEHALGGHDVMLLRLVDSLCQTGSVPDDLWEAVREHWSETQLLTVLALAGWYHAVCFVANGSRTAREPWAATFPTSEEGRTPRGVSGDRQDAL